MTFQIRLGPHSRHEHTLNGGDHHIDGGHAFRDPCRTHLVAHTPGSTCNKHICSVASPPLPFYTAKVSWPYWPAAVDHECRARFTAALAEATCSLSAVGCCPLLHCWHFVASTKNSRVKRLYSPSKGPAADKGSAMSKFRVSMHQLQLGMLKKLAAWVPLVGRPLTDGHLQDNLLCLRLARTGG